MQGQPITVTQTHRHTGTQAHRHNETEGPLRSGTQAHRHNETEGPLGSVTAVTAVPSSYVLHNAADPTRVLSS